MTKTTKATDTPDAKTPALDSPHMNYLQNRIATDLWSMVRSEYIDLAPFA